MEWKGRGDREGGERVNGEGGKEGVVSGGIGRRGGWKRKEEGRKERIERRGREGISGWRGEGRVGGEGL